ncbi:MAG: hypothetical protein FWD61_01635 [Phycisphaerales bacterium]|nr:hypothetical protein [Phycisphaerales bacterium]
MNMLVPIAMFGWIPVVLGLFWLLPPRRAVIVAFLFAWLFLPMAEYKVPGITAYTKMTATCAGVMLAACLFDGQRLLTFLPKLLDLPMAVWCLCPFASSISNDLDVYDGCSAVAYQTITWGLPYLIGRLYFTDLESLKELAIGIVTSGLVYVPLCLFEVKMSPQLHTMVYGYYQHSFLQVIRFGGWRPTVFMQHGLMVGMWMSMASMVGIWLWYTKALRKLWGMPVEWLMFAVAVTTTLCKRPIEALKKLWIMPVGWLMLYLLVTTVLCKSTGALALLAGGLGTLYFARRMHSSAVLWCLVACAPLYIGLRTSGLWSGENLITLTERWTNAERAESLEFRMHNENLLAAKAMQRPVFGWGGWGRNQVENDEGKDETVADGLWIITLGTTGLVGLTALTTMILLPVVLFLRRWPAKSWSQPAVAPAAVLAVMLALYMIDNILNAMINPIFVMTAGGMGGVMSAQACRADAALGRGCENLPQMGYIGHGV